MLILGNMPLGAEGVSETLVIDRTRHAAMLTFVNATCEESTCRMGKRRRRRPADGEAPALQKDGTTAGL